jgi:hypothetical protein
LLASPALAAFVLRLRLMAPPSLPDPAMHTAYIVDPHSVFSRFATLYAPISGLRESARVGFLAPARLAYLAFGAVPGFFVLRYAFALLAIIPVYLLLRRVYGPPAGVVGVIAVLSSPVIITAWGTDYPDSAVVSYAAAAIACLAMPCSARWRRAWLLAAGGLLTLAVWSHGVAVPLVAATLAGYVAVRLVRDRAGLAGDLALLSGIAAAVTGLLIVASALLIGNANFIATTLDAYRYLSQPDQIAQWHSASWAWAPYVAYLLVPPALLGALAVAVARAGRSISTPVLLVGVIAAAQLGLYAFLQFFSTLQDLEEHYFSSTLWAGSCLVLAITVAEIARPLADRPIARWIPAVVLLAVPLAYETDPHVPAFGWLPVGLALAIAVVAVTAAAGWAGKLAHPLVSLAAVTAGVAAITGAALVLTVAPIPQHKALPGTVPDPVAAYNTALGGSAADLIANYEIATQLPLFAGPAYNGERLVVWWPLPDHGFPYTEYVGIFHGLFNSLESNPPSMSHWTKRILTDRRPAEVLLLDSSAALFPQDIRALAHYRPLVLKTGTLRSGSLILHVMLLRLRLYYHPPRHG